MKKIYNTMQFFRLKSFTILISTCTFLSACGGGSTADDEATATLPPSANAQDTSKFSTSTSSFASQQSTGAINANQEASSTAKAKALAVKPLPSNANIKAPRSELAAPIALSITEEAWKSPRIAYDIHATGIDRFVLQNSSRAEGQMEAKFTVKPGDVVGSSSGERSEIVLGGWESTSRFSISGDEGVEFYRISVKLNNAWEAPERNSAGYMWGSFFQAHGPNEFSLSPAIAMFADSKFSLFVLGGDVNNPVGGLKPLTRSNLNAGEWVDFVLRIKWATDETGAVTVYRRDAGETSWDIVADIQATPTLQFKGASGIKRHYWKAGFYRSESRSISSLTLGPILRGRNFSDVTSQ